MLVGTMGYMSPEQIQAELVGPTSDIFSLGCVLYEMVSGKRAFQGRTPAATLSAILRDTPPCLSSFGIQTPPEFSGLIVRCLEKNPSARFQSARDVADDLKTASSRRRRPNRCFTKHRNSIAILPFANAGGDLDSEYLCEGVTESIINRVVQLAQLRVTPRSTVFRYKGMDIDPQAIGRELKVRVVLTGRVVRRGESLVVATELIDVAEGTQLWGERYSRRMADVFELEEEIARKISESLRVKLTGEQKQRLTKRFTGNPEAYQLYLKGRHYWIQRTPESMRKSVGYFQEAIERDPEYALGLRRAGGLLQLYGSLFVCPLSGRDGRRPRCPQLPAVALDAELADGHTSFGFIRGYADRDLATAGKEFREGHRSSTPPPGWRTFGMANVLSIFSRYTAAEEQFQYALELEPLSPVVMQGAAFNSISGRRFDEAVDRCLKGLDIHPDYANFRLWLGVAYECQARYEEAIGEFEKAGLSLTGVPIVTASRAHAHAMSGDPEESSAFDEPSAGGCG